LLEHYETERKAFYSEVGLPDSTGRGSERGGQNEGFPMEMAGQFAGMFLLHVDGTGEF